MRQSKSASAGPVQTPAASKFVTSRRAMLVGLPALGLGAGIAAVAIKAGTSASAGAPVKTDPRQLYYRETEHIRTYYALARR